MAKKSKKSTKRKNNKGILSGLGIVIALLFVAYSVFWFTVADAAKTAYVEEVSKITDSSDVSAPKVSGFPAKLHLKKAHEMRTREHQPSI